MNGKRKLLMALSGATAAAVWQKPVVDSVSLPAHALTTGNLYSTETPSGDVFCVAVGDDQVSVQAVIGGNRIFPSGPPKFRFSGASTLNQMGTLQLVASGTNCLPSPCSPGPMINRDFIVSAVTPSSVLLSLENRMGDFNMVTLDAVPACPELPGLPTCTGGCDD